MAAEGEEAWPGDSKDLSWIDNDKTINNHWEGPDFFRWRVLLYQNQLWLSRQRLLAFFDREIAKIKASHIPGINEYWDRSKIEYLAELRKMFAELDINDAEELQSLRKRGAP